MFKRVFRDGRVPEQDMLFLDQLFSDEESYLALQQSASGIIAWATTTQGKQPSSSAMGESFDLVRCLSRQ